MSAHHHHDIPESTKSLRLAFFLNVGFTLIELVGGIWTNSVAIMSDAVHDLGDSISLGLAWYFDRLSKRGPTAVDTYGYRRYSLIGGLLTGLLLCIGLGFVLWTAVGRLANPEPVNEPGMMLIAVIGIVVNGAAALRVRKGTSLTERLVSWHLLEDTLGWVAVLLGAVAMNFWNVPLIDPALSIAISLFVLWNVGKNLRPVFNVFIQKAPANFDATDFERQMLRHPKISSVHHTHIWSIDGQAHVLTTHLVMDADTHRDEILAAKRHVLAVLGDGLFEHVTVDVELEGEPCATRTGDEAGHGLTRLDGV